MMMNSFAFLLVVMMMTLLLRSPMASSLSTVDLKQRVALVTGANKGIGFEIAKKLSAAGMITILACRTDGKEAAATLGCDHAVYLDLTDDASIAQCRDYVEQTFGTLDVLVNNAAICFNSPTLYGKVPHTPFEKQAHITIETNFFGTYKLTNALLPLMNKSGRIINIASSAGRLGIMNSQEMADLFTQPDLSMELLETHMNTFVRDVEDGVHLQYGWPNTCYGMSKLGIIAFTKVLAKARPDLLVNSVDPGYCATDQNNNQGTRPAAVGALTPFFLATVDADYTGKHWFDEKEIPW
jgi:carbonyl reductase 1